MVFNIPYRRLCYEYLQKPSRRCPGSAHKCPMDDKNTQIYSPCSVSICVVPREKQLHKLGFWNEVNE
jgi:hypothetical protein